MGIIEVKEMPIKDLKFAPYNPRKISEQQMKALKLSIEKNGLVNPIIWNKKTGFVVGGNQRLAALIDLEYEKTWVAVIDVSEEREKAINLALNKISGDWDYEMLKDMFQSISEDDWEMTGFQPSEISILNADDLDFDLSDFKETAQEMEGQTKDIRDYIVYLTFSEKEEADRWLEENGFEEQFKSNARTMVIEMT